ncbi:hypothetical protein BT96DRAFT_961330 [Gymnopus androsaceus JB14]|uniref:GLTSCR protein conserved domain-containing protein n=1 Tax=Gymnopus androsaceus JB14 TaxID=1447944 RepID=A0A6A4ILR7_9AGAR|nr:hypothetical protein BT96DRAFT_961330 [Gymnopus androsaceus JB14]
MANAISTSSPLPSSPTPNVATYSFDTPVSSSFAGPSTWRPPTHWNIDSNGSLGSSGTIKKPLRTKDRTLEEKELITETTARVSSRLAADHSAVLNPDVETHFTDAVDAVNRLLPYHVFLQPKEDLEPLLCDRKGKTKAADSREVEETKFALECYRRRKKLQERFRKARIKGGDGTEFSPQHVVLTQSVLDSERVELAALNAELRAARSEFDRLEREKRASSNPPIPTNRPAYYAPTGQSAYYRHYPYAYAPSYGLAATPSQITTSTPTFPTPPTASSSAPHPVNQPPLLPNPTMSTYPANSAIPVQLPIASMPALTRLGIVPTPAASLIDGQPAPPAILRGSSNGMLNIEINISSLQPTQMSGLALILNSLMSRGPSTVSTTVPASAPVLSLSPPAPVSSTELRLAPPDKT